VNGDLLFNLRQPLPVRKHKPSERLGKGSRHDLNECRRREGDHGPFAGALRELALNPLPNSGVSAKLTSGSANILRPVSGFGTLAELFHRSDYQ